MVRQCGICHKSYSSAESLRRHRRTIHKVKPPSIQYKCNECTFLGNGLSDIAEHFSTQHGTRCISTCPYCVTVFRSSSDLQTHIRDVHGLPITTTSTVETKDFEVQSVFNKGIEVFTLQPNKHYSDLLEFMMDVKEKVDELVKTKTVKQLQKLQFVAEVEFFKPQDEEKEAVTYYASSIFKPVYYIGLDDEFYIRIIDNMLNGVFSFSANGSGWVINRIKSLELKFVRYAPLRASSYLPTPTDLLSSQALLNIRNQDANCFAYCFTAAYHQCHGPPLWTPNNPWRQKSNPATYSTDAARKPRGDFEYPMAIRDIGRFESQNCVSVSVFRYIDKELVPLRVSKTIYTTKMDVLLLEDGNMHHYVLITSLEKLVCHLKKIRNRDGMMVCRNCMSLIYEDGIDAHEASCYNFEAVNINMPKPGTNVTFKKTPARWFSPVTVYFDLESLIIPINGPKQDPSRSSTQNIEKHTPCGYGVAVIGLNEDKPLDVRIVRDENCMEDLVRYLEGLAYKLYYRKRKFAKNIPQPTVPADATLFCWICEQKFEETDVKVLDHDHYSGSFLGWGHNSCNLNRRSPKFTPVLAHNLQNYDMHHLCLALDAASTSSKLRIIPSTDEKYISLSLDVWVDCYRDRNNKIVNVYEELRFLDSYKFMLSSLDRLVSYLSPEQFIYIDNHFNNFSAENRNLLKKKGFYPYSYFDSFDKFNLTSLPPLNCWHNSLTGTIDISSCELQTASVVYEVFECNTLGDYHNLYLTCDVLLLASVFEEFRKICYKAYGLDCTHYYTASNLSGDAFLKVCNPDLELLADREHLTIAENLLRGGVSSVFAKRKFTANNKYLPNYKENEISTFGLMIDANNLYGGVMEHYSLPLKDFKFNDDISLDLVLNTTADSSVGYILEVDIEYPVELHDIHSDFPLAPEKLEINKDWLSDYQHDLIGATTRPTIQKLVQTVFNKTRYTVHYMALKLYVELGLKVTHIYRVLEFQQSKWLSDYIVLNTQKRKSAKNKFEETFYKLMSNSAYGKCCENKRRRQKIDLVRDSAMLLRSTDRLNIKQLKIFSNNLAAITYATTTVVMDKPIIVGAAILDLAKMFMYEFHFKQMKKHFDCEVLYSDTDSLVYEIRTNDLYADLQRNAQLRTFFDFSNYPQQHTLFAENNKLTTLKFKDELRGELMVEFIGLKSKMYSIKTEGETKKSAKGITYNAQKSLTHENYQNILNGANSERIPNVRIGSRCHEISTTITNKVGLSAFDDKRFILPDGITTLPYGHTIAQDSFFARTIANDVWSSQQIVLTGTDDNYDTVTYVSSVPNSSSSSSHGENTRPIQPWSTPDPGFFQQEINESDLSSVDWNFADDDSPLRNPFIDNEAVESDRGESPTRLVSYSDSD